MKNINHSPKHINLTAVEVGVLWNTYMIESMVHHMSCYFIKHIEDPNIKEMVKYWIDSTGESIRYLESYFKQENLAVPIGITSEDINPDAPRLFTDNYIVLFGDYMSRFALNTFTLGFSQCSRLDMREFMKRHFVDRLIHINQQAIEISISKGVYVRPPYLPIPNEVDFVKKRSFFSGYFGDKRPLTVLEITQLFNNAHANAMGKATMIAFSQVAKSKEIRDYFLEGREIANKLYKEFINILIDENIEIPPNLSGEIYDSTESPFSDKLMLFNDTLLSAAGIGNYGMAVAQIPRNDLAVLYGKVTVETGAYAKNGANLMIKNGWMEQPPIAPDRDALAKSNK